MDEQVESELSIKKLYHQLALGFQKSPLTIGVGEIYPFSEIKESYYEALKALIISEDCT